jgi:hypothetical protein
VAHTFANMEGMGMEAQKSNYNRNLLIILTILFLVSIAALVYAALVIEPGMQPWWTTLLNILILSIPLILVYGSIYVLVAAWREHSRLGQVSPGLAKIIHWAPRVAAIAIILFMGLFSLDVFEGEATLLERLGGLLIHNLPSLVMLVLLILAWKRPAVGFAAYLVIGGLFILFFVRSIYAAGNLVMFLIPILLIAGLFYADWKWLN